MISELDLYELKEEARKEAYGICDEEEDYDVCEKCGKKIRG